LEAALREEVERDCGQPAFLEHAGARELPELRHLHVRRLRLRGSLGRAQGEHENLYCEAYRGETASEKFRAKYIWLLKTTRFGGSQA